MKTSDKSKYFVVGLVLIVALIILVFGIMFLDEQDPRETKVQYFVMFEQVSTLQPGDPIKVNGVKSGKVSHIALHQASRKVLVTLDVVDSIRIPDNSDFRVRNIGLMGERQVVISLGDSPEYLEKGAQIEGQFDAGIAEVMGYAGVVFDSTAVLLKVVKEVLDSTVANDRFKESFKSIFAKAERLEDRLEVMIDDTDPVLQSSLGNLKRASVKVNQFLDNNMGSLETLLTQTTESTTKTKVLLTKVDSLTNRLLALSGKLQATDNTVGAMLNDTAFYNKLNTTLISTDSLFNVIIDDGLDVNVDIF
ncbi:MAG: MlaD family protein [Fibrobacterales bacterium]